MRKYEFSLQSALDLRIREEEQAQRRLARAMRLVRDRRSDLERTRERHDAIVNGMRTNRGRTVTVSLGEAEHASRVLADLRQRISRQRERLAEAQRECAARREELIEASQARRTLERLSERREADFRREQSRLEQKELNEAAISRHRSHADTGLSGVLAGSLDDAA